MLATGPVPWDTEQVGEGWRRPSRPPGRECQTETNPHKLLLYIGDSSCPMARRYRHEVSFHFWGQCPRPVRSSHGSGLLPLALAGLIIVHIAWCPCLALDLWSSLPPYWPVGSRGQSVSFWSPCAPPGLEKCLACHRQGVDSYSNLLIVFCSLG